MDFSKSQTIRAGWVGVMFAASALPMLVGCELVVDFDRDRIVDDAGIEPADMRSADMPVGDMSEPDATMCADPGECDDSIACTVDDCTSGTCDHVPMDAMCDDSNACTADSCDALTGCANTSLCSLDVNAGALTLDLTTVLTVPGVGAGVDGFLVVYDATGSTVFGSTAVGAGASSDVDVHLDRQLATDDMVIVRLHEDLGAIGTFEPGTDLVANDGADVEAMVTVSVPGGTPDLEVTVSGDGSDYTFSMARSSVFAGAGSLSGADPELTLVRGLRYRFVNLTAAAHPLELITDGAPGVPGDTEQLVQGTFVGPLEADGSIDWVDASGVVEATVTATFETAIDAYRCSIHTADMRGTILYTDP